MGLGETTRGVGQSIEFTDRSTHGNLVDNGEGCEGKVVGKPGSHMKKKKTNPYLETCIMKTSRSIKTFTREGFTTIIFVTQELLKTLKHLKVKLMRPKSTVLIT